MVHSAVSTAATEVDVLQVGASLHGREKAVFGDAGYRGADKYAGKRGRRFYII